MSDPKLFDRVSNDPLTDFDHSIKYSSETDNEYSLNGQQNASLPNLRSTEVGLKKTNAHTKSLIKGKSTLKDTLLHPSWVFNFDDSAQYNNGNLAFLPSKQKNEPMYRSDDIILKNPVITPQHSAIESAKLRPNSEYKEKYSHRGNYPYRENEIGGHEEIKLMVRNKGSSADIIFSPSGNIFINSLTNQSWHAFTNLQRQDISLIDEACRSGNLNSIKGILPREPSFVNVMINGEFTPLHSSSKMGNTEIVRYLVENGADIMKVSYYEKQLPLHLAAYSGNISTIKYLLCQYRRIQKRGLDDLKFDQLLDGYGRSMLHYCAKGGRAKALEYLISIGSDINLKDNSQLTPLHLATLNRAEDINENGSYDEVIEILLLNNANPLIKGQNHFISNKIIEYLVKLKMLIEVKRIEVKNAANSLHYTALQMAVIVSDPREISIFLLELESDIVRVQMFTSIIYNVTFFDILVFRGNDQNIDSTLTIERAYLTIDEVKHFIAQHSHLFHHMLEHHCYSSLWNIFNWSLDIKSYGKRDDQHVNYSNTHYAVLIEPRILDVYEDGDEALQNSKSFPFLTRNDPTILHQLVLQKKANKLLDHPLVKVCSYYKYKVYSLWHLIQLVIYLIFLSLFTLPCLQYADVYSISAIGCYVSEAIAALLNVYFGINYFGEVLSLTIYKYNVKRCMILKWEHLKYVSRVPKLLWLTPYSIFSTVCSSLLAIEFLGILFTLLSTCFRSIDLSRVFLILASIFNYLRIFKHLGNFRSFELYVTLIFNHLPFVIIKLLFILFLFTTPFSLGFYLLVHFEKKSNNSFKSEFCYLEESAEFSFPMTFVEYILAISSVRSDIKDCPINTNSIMINFGRILFIIYVIIIFIVFVNLFLVQILASYNKIMANRKIYELEGVIKSEVTTIFGRSVTSKILISKICENALIRPTAWKPAFKENIHYKNKSKCYNRIMNGKRIDDSNANGIQNSIVKNKQCNSVPASETDNLLFLRSLNRRVTLLEDQYKVDDVNEEDTVLATNV